MSFVRVYLSVLLFMFSFREALSRSFFSEFGEGILRPNATSYHSTLDKGKFAFGGGIAFGHIDYDLSKASRKFLPFFIEGSYDAGEKVNLIVYFGYYSFCTNKSSDYVRSRFATFGFKVNYNINGFLEAWVPRISEGPFEAYITSSLGVKSKKDLMIFSKNEYSVLSNSTYLSLGISIGAKYSFNNNSHLYAELGRGYLGVLSIGYSIYLQE